MSGHVGGIGGDWFQGRALSYTDRGSCVRNAKHTAPGGTAGIPEVLPRAVCFAYLIQLPRSV